MAHRLAPHAQRDIDDIWLHVAKESGSIEIANRGHYGSLHVAWQFWVYRALAESDFGPGYRSLAVGEYIIVYYIEDQDVLILRVVHGRRDLERPFGH